MVVILALTLLVFGLIWIDKKIHWPGWVNEIYGMVLMLTCGVDIVLISLKIAKAIGLL